jgi:hypothetical protein
MTLSEVLRHCRAVGLRIRTDGRRVLAFPRERLTDEIRELIREHSAEIVASLSTNTAASENTAVDTPEPVAATSGKGHECMSCANLRMRVERHEGSRRLFWWRCEKGYPLTEARSFGQQVIIAPPECDAAGAFQPWRPGQR